MNQKRNFLYSDVPSVLTKDRLTIAELSPPGPKSLELEIGFGKGRFILDRAEANPETGIIGLETRRKWVHLVTERAEKREISNARVWLGDAKTALPKIEEEACIKRVFINFPDPWWKERHVKRMVIVDDLINQVARLLVDGGEIFVQTDVDFRAEHYLEVISSNENFMPAGENGRVKENPFGARTLREIRCEEVGLPIYRILFSRKHRR